MDPIKVIAEIDRVRCLVHQVFGVDSQSAMAGIALYRAALADKKLIEDSEERKQQ